MKKFLLLLLLIGSLQLKAQNVAGYWYGVGSVEGGKGNNYLVEIIMNQRGTSVQAIMNYYFRNTFRSLKVAGSYNAKTRELMLFDIPLPYFGSNSNMEVDCKMNFTATHRVAIAGSNLTGRFAGQEAYKYTCPNIVFDLRLNNEANNQDSILTALRNFKETFQVWTPTATDTLVSATVLQRTIQNPVVNREFTERALDVQKEIEVEGDSVTVDFYDNGEIDGDSISVFFNSQLFGANLRLSTKSVQMKLKLDSTKEVNTLAMFANNLGSIPPNTALMMVWDGKTRYEVRLSSSLQKSAAVNIRRRKRN